MAWSVKFKILHVAVLGDWRKNSKNAMKIRFLCNIKTPKPCFWSLYSDKRTRWLKNDFGRMKKYALQWLHFDVFEFKSARKNDIFFEMKPWNSSSRIRRIWNKDETWYSFVFENAFQYVQWKYLHLHTDYANAITN